MAYYCQLAGYTAGRQPGLRSMGLVGSRWEMPDRRIVRRYASSLRTARLQHGRAIVSACALAAPSAYLESVTAISQTLVIRSRNPAATL